MLLHLCGLWQDRHRDASGRVSKAGNRVDGAQARFLLFHEIGVRGRILGRLVSLWDRRDWRNILIVFGSMRAVHRGVLGRRQAGRRHRLREARLQRARRGPHRVEARCRANGQPRAVRLSVANLRRRPGRRRGSRCLPGNHGRRAGVCARVHRDGRWRGDAGQEIEALRLWHRGQSLHPSSIGRADGARTQAGRMRGVVRPRHYGGALPSRRGGHASATDTWRTGRQC